MSKKPTKAADNVYCIARLNAASYNDRLSSREGAAEVTGIDRTRLARIELGSLMPYPEEVQLLSDVYNAPELENYHCSNDCPIGRRSVPLVAPKGLDRIALEINGAAKNIEAANEAIMTIAEDGVITANELPELERAMEVLDKLSEKAIALKIHVQKYVSIQKE